MTTGRNKQNRVSWECPDVARRRAAALRQFREWMMVLGTLYAAFGPKLHI